MEVTIGPAWDEDIAMAVKNALEERSSSSERRLGLDGGFCTKIDHYNQTKKFCDTPHCPLGGIIFLNRRVARYLKLHGVYTHKNRR